MITTGVFDMDGVLCRYRRERRLALLASWSGRSPEAIRDAFGVSKKAFKQALGALYKRRRIRFAKPGIELLDESESSREQNE